MNKNIYLLLILFTIFFSCKSELIINQEKRSDLSILVISSDHSLGENTLRFAVIDNEGKIVEEDLTKITIKNIESGMSSILIEAQYEEWFTGKGAYKSELSLSEPGNFEIMVERDDKSYGYALFQVAKNSLTPKIGFPPPKIDTKSAKNYEDIINISSDPKPNFNLYKITYEEAITNNLPTIIVFSTPGLCVSGTCGPLLEHVKQLSTIYQDCNYIHVEVYENFIGKSLNDIDSLIVSSPTKAWSLPTEPWVFFLDREGILNYKLEGFATYEELLDLTEGILNYQ